MAALAVSLCDACGITFRPDRPGQVLCNGCKSELGWEVAVNGREGWVAKSARTCAWPACGKQFIAKAPAQKYCGYDCRVAAVAVQAVEAEKVKAEKAAARAAAKAKTDTAPDNPDAAKPVSKPAAAAPASALAMWKREHAVDLEKLRAELKVELRAELKVEIVAELRELVVSAARDVAGERTEQCVEQIMVRVWRNLTAA